MRLPRWFRHFSAHLGVSANDEISGRLFDYANGKWELLHKWSDDNGKAEAIALAENMLEGSRDAIYVASMNFTEDCGLYQAVDSQGRTYERFWALNVYTPQEAYEDFLAYLRARAKQMGWPEIQWTNLGPARIGDL